MKVGNLAQERLLEIGDMGIRIGIIDYNRPSQPVKACEVRQLLAVGGKDVIRLAWASLNPDSSNDIKHEALASWLCEFFNMRRNDGQGTECISVLCSLNLLYKHGDWVKPEFDL